MTRQSNLWQITLLLLAITATECVAQEPKKASVTNWQKVLHRVSEDLPRRETCLNGIWEFRCDSDEEWTTLRVPGCYTDCRVSKWAKEYWDAYGRPRQWSDQGATYRRKLTLTSKMLSRPLRFRCGGCFQVCRVLLNGKEVGRSQDGYVPIVSDLNAAAVEGTNTLEVVVGPTNGPLSGGESNASRGIWQDTFLVSHHHLFVDGRPAIQTSVAAKNLACLVPITNRGTHEESFQVCAVVTDRNGKVQHVVEGSQETLAAGAGTTVRLSGAWEDARPWYPHDPHLYTMHVLVLDKTGKVVDHWKDRFGFREVTWKGPHLYLNGRELYLRGHGGHYLGDLQGTKEYCKTWFREFKKRGINFMRPSIYPKHLALYEAADEVGFLLIGEPAFHFHVPKRTIALSHLGDMIDNLRNHPSIIMWAVSNELRWRGGGEKPWLIDCARKKDPTRPAFSSDFTAFSTHGDLAGHHYNTNAVFSEWEKYAPDKPMVWDECGSVWEPNRPIHNGTAGYEVTSQDCASGTYRDAKDEIMKAMDVIRTGKVFAGELHRVNAVVPWDLGYVFYRWQPYNRFRGIVLKHPHPEAKGIQPEQILPCSSPLNIWDPTLPIYEPYPGFYILEEELKWIRFPGENKARSFFGGDVATVKSPLFFYEDLRLVDTVRCRVERADGTVLTEKSQPMALVPGQMLRDVSWSFTMPKVKTATAVKIVREFVYQGKPGYRDVRDGMVYPRLNARSLDNRCKLGVFDPSGVVRIQLAGAGIPFTPVTTLAERVAVDILLVVGTDQPPSLTEQIQNGLRVVQLMPAKAEYVNVKKRTACELLNGPRHRCLEGLRQEEFTFWRDGPVHGAMGRPEGARNCRVILAADRDGTTSALHEEYRGSGLRVVTSLRIADSLDKEPAAGWMLRNLLRAAGEYQPRPTAKRVALFGSKPWKAYLNQVSLVATSLDALSAASLKDVDVLLVEADASSGADQALATFAERGGQVLVQKLTRASLRTFQKAADERLALTEPFLGKQTHCVKAALCWTLRDTPQKGVEYYEKVVIPQPFEPNHDPLLAGIANVDLTWGGKKMFAQGVRVKGMNPVGLNKKVQILVSNWDIDWSLPPFGGEYIQVGKDMRRANWFLYRDPVLLRVKRGAGAFLFSQLDVAAGGARGLRLMRTILTNLGCSLGSPTQMAENERLFDFAPAKEQEVRLAKVEKQIAALTPLPKLPETLARMVSDRGEGDLRVLLLLDSRMASVQELVVKQLKTLGSVSQPTISFNTADELAGKLEKTLGTSQWDIVYFTLGSHPLPGDEKKATEVINKVVDRLKKNSTTLMWGAAPAWPAAKAEKGINDAIVHFNSHARKIMLKNDVYVFDSHDFLRRRMKGYLAGKERNFNQKQKETLAKAIVDAIKFYGN